MSAQKTVFGGKPPNFSPEMLCDSIEILGDIIFPEEPVDAVKVLDYVSCNLISGVIYNSVIAKLKDRDSYLTRTNMKAKITADSLRRAIGRLIEKSPSVSRPIGGKKSKSF